MIKMIINPKYKEYTRQILIKKKASILSMLNMVDVFAIVLILVFSFGLGKKTFFTTFSKKNYCYLDNILIFMLLILGFLLSLCIFFFITEKPLVHKEKRKEIDNDNIMY